MPYAFAHPAAVVPVARMLGARAVPSALAIGAMIPDAWYIVPLVDRDYSHELADALWFCLPAGVLVYVVFHLLFKHPLLALAPRWLEGRLAAWTTPGLPRVAWRWMLLSLCAGIATHLAWDTFTHSGHFAFLDVPVAGRLSLHQILQHASTLLGTAFLAVWLWRKLRTTHPTPSACALPARLRLAVVVAMIGFPGAAFFGVLRTMDAHAWPLALRAAGATALTVFCVVALVYSLGWKLAR